MMSILVAFPRPTCGKYIRFWTGLLYVLCGDCSHPLQRWPGEKGTPLPLRPMPRAKPLRIA